MADQPQSLPWHYHIVSWIGAAYLHLVGQTSFIHRLDDPKFQKIYREKKPLIYAFWHNTQVFLAYGHRGDGVNVMVSRSKDGEYIAQVMRRMKLNAVRGSTSKGGERALKQICQRLQEGKQAGFTPDGPRGPVQTVHGGVVLAARASGCPVVPLTIVSRRRLEFNSWDRFFIPLPFSTIVFAHGEPFYLNRDMDIDASKEKVRKALNAVTERAKEAEKKLPSWFDNFLVRALYGVNTLVLFVLSPLWISFLFAKFGFKRSLANVAERFGGGEVPFPSGSKGPHTPGAHSGGRPFRLWFHAASLGEWSALKPLIQEFKSNPDISLAVTVSTPEARRLVAQEEPGLVVRMLPLDWPLTVRRWISRLSPDALVIIETELWPHLIRETSRRHIPLYLVNGRLSERALQRWRLLKSMGQNIVNSFNHLMVRTEEDGRRYQSLGAPAGRITVVGNTKLDNARVSKPEERRQKRLEWFGGDEGVYLVGGSMWPGEEETLVELLRADLPQRIRLILAPRRLERCGEVAQLLKSNPFSWSRFSEVKKNRHWTTDVLLVDTIGDLKELYRTADIAFIGGSLNPRGGQNPLEAACARAAVIFGPSMENFQEESAGLQQAGAALQARTKNELLLALQKVASTPSLQAEMSRSAASFIEQRQGVSKKVAKMLMEGLGI